MKIYFRFICRSWIKWIVTSIRSTLWIPASWEEIRENEYFVGSKLFRIWKQNTVIFLSFHNLHPYFWSNKSTRNISSKNTDDTSSHIYTECAEGVNITCKNFYSELENKTWPYLSLSVRLISSPKASIHSVLWILVTSNFIHQWYIKRK